jgi:hypothetical protein
MPSPKDDPGLLDVWQQKEKEYTCLGLSRLSALKKIANEYSVSPKTVYYWLTPEYRAHELSESRKKQKRERAMRPENRARLYQYSRNYMHYRRHLDSYVEDLFLESEGSPMTLLSISEKLERKTKIRFDKKFILGAIAKYNCEHENNPIEEIEYDLYRMKP